MAAKVIKTTFLIRKGTSEAWNRVNPILKYGEPGYEKDTNKLKIGDGITEWNSLPYFGDSFDITADGKSIVFTNNNLELCGYANAEIGQIPIKGDNGLEWTNAPAAISLEDLREIFNQGGENNG